MRAARGRRRWRAGIAVLTLLSGGCTWYSMTPRERPAPLPATAARALDTLVLDLPREAVLDCSRNACNQWYRLDVPHAGTLEVKVETRPAEQRPVTRLVVQPLGESPVAQTMGGTADVLSVHPKVHGGLYMVLVQAGGGRLPYTLTARLAPDPSEAMREAE